MLDCEFGYAIYTGNQEPNEKTSIWLQYGKFVYDVDIFTFQCNRLLKTLSVLVSTDKQQAKRSEQKNGQCWPNSEQVIRTYGED